jgi:rhodanese-related sulfurtransferase
VDVPQIEVSELASRQAAGAALIDVRQPFEYDEAHVPGAVLIPLDELVERVDEVPESREVLLICATGSRSNAAGEWLLRQGIDAVNVAGGVMAWMDQGAPVVTGPEPG